MHVDMVVVKYEKDEEFKSFLESVKLAYRSVSPDITLRLLIFDNSLNKIDIKKFQDPKIEIIYIKSEENFFHSAGINYIFEKYIPQSGYSVIINPDVYLPSNFFNVLRYEIDTLIENSRIAAIDFRQIPFDHPKVVFNNGETDWVSGAGFLIQNRYFFEVGMFDAVSFPMYMNDVDLSIRLTINNYKLLSSFACFIFHRKRIFNDEISSSDYEYIQSIQGYIKIYYKYKQEEKLKEYLNIIKLDDRINSVLSKKNFIKLTDTENLKHIKKIKINKRLQRKFFVGYELGETKY